MHFPIPQQLNFSSFEEAFLPQFLKAKPTGTEIIFDLSMTEWADLMELLCLSVAADTCRTRWKNQQVSFIFPQQRDDCLQ